MRKTRLFTSALGTAADAALGFPIPDAAGQLQDNLVQTVLTAISAYRDFTIQTLAGSVRVKGSLDGTNFGDQLALTIETVIAADVPAEQFGAIVAVTSSAKFAHFSGDYRAIKVEQVGATPAQIRLLAAGDE